MSFTWPIALAGLLLVPLGLLGYWLVQRRRMRYAVRFTNLDLLSSVVDKTPAWRRHVPAGLALLALTALVLAVARPTMAMEVAKDQSTVVLTVDVSGSMAAEDVAPTRIEAARQAANAFLDEVPEGVKVGLVSFSDSANVEIAPTTNLDSVRAAVNRLQPGGGTALGDAIARSADLARSSVQETEQSSDTTTEGAPAVVLLLSDGANSTGTLDPAAGAQVAEKDGVPIHTVALGTPTGTVEIDPDGNGVQTIPVPPDPETLQQVSSDTGGQFFDAPDAVQLKDVYERMGAQVAKETEQKDVSYAFAGVGAVLLLTGASLSAFWFNRIP
jgi:Ca-activated chloride channel homolog